MRSAEKRKLIFFLWTRFFADRILRDQDAHAHRLASLQRALPGTSPLAGRVQRFGRVIHIFFRRLILFKYKKSFFLV